MNSITITLAVLCAVVISCHAAADPLRDHIMCIIETQLSSDACKSTARAQAQAGSDPATACSTLETFRLLLPIVGCTTNDYNILHSVICEHKDVPCTPAGR